MANETVATYQDGEITYEIDHLGVGFDAQWGEFAVYCGGKQVAEFAIPESALKPEYRPADIPATAELVAHAREAVAYYAPSADAMTTTDLSSRSVTGTARRPGRGQRLPVTHRGTCPECGQPSGHAPGCFLAGGRSPR